jgi:2-polyprenyl-3-methyl-5-hydroxy-6-metoxy-1,4-benzoquinol methylase
MLKIDYSRHYRKWHTGTIEGALAMFPYYKSLLKTELTGISKNAEILDVGCGMGLTLFALSKMGFENTTGIDVSKEQIENSQLKGLNLLVVPDSVAFLNGNPKKYDVIVSLDVIEHIPLEHQMSFCNSISKSLKDNGKFICTVPNANSTLASRWRYIDWTHHASFTEHSLDFLLYNSGFTKIEIKPIEFITRPSIFKIKSFLHWLLFKSIRLFRRLEIIAELGTQQGKTIPLSLNIVAIAKK